MASEVANLGVVAWLKAMPLDPRRSIPIYRATFRAAKTWQRLFLFVVFPALLLTIDETWLTDQLFSSFQGLRDKVSRNPVGIRIFQAINLLAATVILVFSLKMKQRIEEENSPEETEDLDTSVSSDCPPISPHFFSNPSAPPMPTDWEGREIPSGCQIGRPAKRGRHDRVGSFFSFPWEYFPSPGTPAEPSAPPMGDRELSYSSDEEISLAEDDTESLDSPRESIGGAQRLNKSKTWSPSSNRDQAVEGKFTKSQTSREHGTGGKEVELDDELEMDRRYEDFIQKARADFIREREESFRRQAFIVPDILDDSDIDNPSSFSDPR